MTSSDDVRQAPGGTAGASPEEIEPIGAEQRWRLVLGLDAQGRRTPLSRQQAGMDQALRTLYDEEARSAVGPAAAWASPPRGWPAGWVTSAPTSPPGWSRSCRWTPWSASA